MALKIGFWGEMRDLGGVELDVREDTEEEEEEEEREGR